MKQNVFSSSLTVNTEKQPQNKTVERITIDPRLSHAQSHLNGRLFLPEEPAQTFKSTANARFSPLPFSLFLSPPEKKTAAVQQLNVVRALESSGGLTRRERSAPCLCSPTLLSPFFVRLRLRVSPSRVNAARLQKCVHPASPFSDFQRPGRPRHTQRC